MTPKEIRSARGLSQAQAATQMGISRSTLSRLERGLQEIQPVHRQKFLHLYGDVPQDVELRPIWDGGNLKPEIQAVLKQASQGYRICRKLEKIAGSRILKEYPERQELPVRKIQGLARISDFARIDSAKIRRILGMDKDPVPELEFLVQEKFLVEIFTEEIDTGLLGVCTSRENHGICIVVGKHLHATQRLETLARLLGLTITDPYRLWIVQAQNPESTQRAYAQIFAERLLIPEILFANNRTDLPDLYHVSLEFLQGRIQGESFRKQRARPPRWDIALPHCLRTRDLAFRLHNPEDPDYILSEEQICRVLDMHRIDFRRMMDEKF